MKRFIVIIALAVGLYFVLANFTDKALKAGKESADRRSKIIEEVLK